MILGAVRVGATLCRASSLCQWDSYEQRDCTGLVVIYRIAFVYFRDPHLRPLVDISSSEFISHDCKELRRSDLASESRSSS